MFKIVVGLPFCWWYVPDGFEKPAVVEPVHVLEGGVLDLVEVTPRGPLVDKFDQSSDKVTSAPGQGVTPPSWEQADRSN